MGLLPLPLPPVPVLGLHGLQPPFGHGRQIVHGPPSLHLLLTSTGTGAASWLEPLEEMLAPRSSSALWLVLWSCTASLLVAFMPPPPSPSSRSWFKSQPSGGRSRQGDLVMKEVRVGVIGAGRIGLVHLEALAAW